MMPSSRRSAFTLIEILVSIILLSMLLGIALVTYRYAILYFKRAVNVFPEKAVRFHQIRNAVGAMEDYIVYPGPPGSASRIMGEIYYRSDPASVSFITRGPVIGEGISLVAFTCAEHRLEYYEQPLYDGTTDYRAPTLSKKVLPLVIFDEIEACRFSDDGSEGKKPEMITLSFKMDEEKYVLHFATKTTYGYVGKVMRGLDDANR